MAVDLFIALTYYYPSNSLRIYNNNDIEVKELVI